MSVSNLMNDYWGTEQDTAPTLLKEAGYQFAALYTHVPVAPSTAQWEVKQDPQRLARTYIFQHAGVLKHFVNELLEYQEDVQHHGSIVIDELSVEIEVFTKNLNSVTEADSDYAHQCDLIYQDVHHYNMDDEDSDQARKGTIVKIEL